MENENFIYSIDRIYFEDGYLKIDGWAINNDVNNTIYKISVIGTNYVKNDVYILDNLYSPDVSNVLGDLASNSRFSIGIELKNKRNFLQILNSRIAFDFEDSKRLSIELFPKEIVDFFLKGRTSFGLAITTYNRANFIEKNIEYFKEKSFFDFDVIISDDGSSDNTPEILENSNNIYWLSSKNKGIAWNKNRCLFYSSAILSNDITLLVEDDVVPNKFGWDIEWILSTIMYGHINYNPPWFETSGIGNGQWNSPYKTSQLTGQCSGFLRNALTYVGYLDSRFGRYGHEHVEHTMRMIRAGYGGELVKAGSREYIFYSINGNIDVLPCESSSSEEDVQKNSEIFDEIWDKSIYRSPWKNDEEMEAFREEMLAFKENKTENFNSGEPYFVGFNHDNYKIYISLLVHECPDVIIDQIENLNKFYNYECVIILHVSKGSTIDVENVISMLLKNKINNVFLNEHRVETKWGNISNAHMENIKVLKDRNCKGILVFHSSNDMVVSSGVYDYVMKNKSGFNSREIQENSYWMSSKGALNDKNLLTLLGEKKDLLRGGQIEGSFYELEKLYEIYEIIVCNNLCSQEEKYPQEEILFPTVANFIGYKSSGFPYVYSEVQEYDKYLWDRLHLISNSDEDEKTKEINFSKAISDSRKYYGFSISKEKIISIRDKDIKNLLKSEIMNDGDYFWKIYDCHNIYGVKRVNRDINDQVRIFIKRNC